MTSTLSAKLSDELELCLGETHFLVSLRRMPKPPLERALSSGATIPLYQFYQIRIDLVAGHKMKQDELMAKDTHHDAEVKSLPVARLDLS